MSFSPLLTLAKVLNPQQRKSVEEILETLPPNSLTTASKFAILADIDIVLASKVLKRLVETEVLSYRFGVRCPQCGLLLRVLDSLAECDDEILCYACEANVEPTQEDVDVFYITNVSHPFMEGQQNRPVLELVKSAAPNTDSLAFLIQQNFYDLHRALYAPTTEQYTSVEKKYTAIFELDRKTTEKGTALEDLIRELFSLCRNLSSSKLRLHPNEIDCYVRNKLRLFDDASIEAFDNLAVECKNEKSTPKAGYMNKLHSIMTTHGIRIGIIASKSKVPKTFRQLAHDIFLRDNIIIIWLDKNDLKEIVIMKRNLLECIDRKIDEVKLNATQDLVTQGLYNA